MKKSYYIIFIVLMSMHVSSKAVGEQNNADKLDELVKVAILELKKNKKNNKPKNCSKVCKDRMRRSKTGGNSQKNRKFFSQLKTNQDVVEILRSNSMPYKIFYSQLRMNKYAVDYQIILEDK